MAVDLWITDGSSNSWRVPGPVCLRVSVDCGANVRISGPTNITRAFQIREGESAIIDSTSTQFSVRIVPPEDGAPKPANEREPRPILPMRNKRTHTEELQGVSG